ncbi:MAG: DEAD/DEAH box helicase, partial [Xanthomonadales bacterium]|nr:DEAD/DEAH box helicase [Xanthomonadales bacterium]
VCDGAREADMLAGSLAFFARPGTGVQQFPDWETLPYDVFSPYQDIVSRRLATLAALPEMRRGIIVIPVSTLMQRIAPPEFVRGNSLRLAKGQSLNPDAFRRKLIAAGYRSVSQVSEHGELAVRGALIDVFPMGTEVPLRIDLFDEEIESLRRFDPDTQMSRDKIDAIEILPAREFPMDERGIRFFRQNFRRRFEGDPTRSAVYREVSEGITPPGVEYFLPLFFENTASFFDYLPRTAVIVASSDLAAISTAHWQEIEERFGQRSNDAERPILRPSELYLAPDELREKQLAFPSVEHGSFELHDTGDGKGQNFGTARPPDLKLDPRSDDPLSRLRAYLASGGHRTLVVAESPGRREALLEQLRDNGLRLPVCGNWQDFLAGDGDAITVGDLDQGLELPQAGIGVVTETQLFGDRARQRRARRRVDRDPDAIIRDLTDLNPGSPVVHEEYGVGRYLGLETLGAGGIETEYLTLEYADGDRLYVPVHALQLISRYTGADPDKAPLHKLGTGQWQKARQRAARKARDVAAELLDIYARRAARGGNRMEFNLREYEAFRAGFPFEETADQAQAIEDVIEDLRAPKSMDRVVCGDVGFGKTEVALRAAFVAVQAGRQVALLVPTTLLAQQHYQTFADRFADWPVNVEVLSRFRTGAAAKSLLQGAAAGTVDIVIGTHRLLQDDVAFKSLGLVIIDEEHRFGVRHKEKLKSLRAEVDVLTLTATPIPRTLNMA